MLNNVLIPQLTQMATNPQGFGPQVLAARKVRRSRRLVHSWPLSRGIRRISLPRRISQASEWCPAGVRLPAGARRHRPGSHQLADYRHCQRAGPNAAVPGGTLSVNNLRRGSAPACKAQYKGDHTVKCDSSAALGKTFYKKVGGPIPTIMNLGMAGYAQFKITGDSGSDIPPALRGFKDRVFALGPEFNIFIPKPRLTFLIRYGP